MHRVGELACRRPAFLIATVRHAQRILKLAYEIPPRVAASPEAQNLLAAMLVARPEQRITIPQVPTMKC